MDEEDLAKIASLSEAQTNEMRVSYQKWRISNDSSIMTNKSKFSEFLKTLFWLVLFQIYIL